MVKITWKLRKLYIIRILPINFEKSSPLPKIRYAWHCSSLLLSVAAVINATSICIILLLTMLTTDSPKPSSSGSVRCWALGSQLDSAARDSFPRPRRVFHVHDARRIWQLWTLERPPGIKRGSHGGCDERAERNTDRNGLPWCLLLTPGQWTNFDIIWSLFLLLNTDVNQKTSRLFLEVNQQMLHFHRLGKLW